MERDMTIGDAAIEYGIQQAWQVENRHWGQLAWERQAIVDSPEFVHMVVDFLLQLNNDDARGVRSALALVGATLHLIRDGSVPCISRRKIAELFGDR